MEVIFKVFISSGYVTPSESNKDRLRAGGVWETGGWGYRLSILTSVSLNTQPNLGII